ncbi:MAG: fenitrothion hydrolase, partial [Solirubrobacterales bacterium]
MRRALPAALVATAVLLAVPAPALAHGVGQRADLPIPLWLFAWGAALVLIASFVALAVLWPRPVLEGLGTRRLFTVPR